MFKSIADDIVREFKTGSRLTRIIIVNIGAFILINLAQLIVTGSTGFQNTGGFDMEVLQYLGINHDLVFNLKHPWVFITHMFAHKGFWHLVWNMLLLYWFGRIVGDFIGDHRILPLYLLAGLAGALVYLITAPFMPLGPFAIGASAAVMGMILASAALSPDYAFQLILIGPVKLKYIAAVLLLLDLFAIGQLSNTGGHLAHLGGAAFGYLFIVMLRNGSDLSEPVNKLFGWIKGLAASTPVKSKPKRKPGRRSGKRKSSPVFVRHKSSRKAQASSDSSTSPQDFQERLDKILDKIKEAGYDSLSAEEKEFLFQASKK